MTGPEQINFRFTGVNTQPPIAPTRKLSVAQPIQIVQNNNVDKNETFPGLSLSSSNPVHESTTDGFMKHLDYFDAFFIKP